MESAYIFGCFRFAGFHLCNTLLEKGWEVVGTDFSVDTLVDFADEKRMEIGRNANFKESPFSKIVDNNAFERKMAVIVSFYDLFMENHDPLLEVHSLFEGLQRLVFLNERELVRPIFLLPIQVLTERDEMDVLAKMRGFFEKNNELLKDAQFFYLPSLFGEWQPNHYLVQKILQKGEEVERGSIREWKGDLLYVNDAIAKVVEMMEIGQSGSYLLESGKTNRWEECLNLLNVPANSENANKNDEKQIFQKEKRITIDNPTHLEEGLARQKEHNDRVQKGWM